MDFSTDGSLLVSGAADKTIKIWGMDFGDCHRSLHAHEDSVSGLRFQPKTHYFFSAGKDGLVKFWDADRWVAAPPPPPPPRTPEACPRLPLLPPPRRMLEAHRPTIL